MILEIEARITGCSQEPEPGTHVFLRFRRSNDSPEEVEMSIDSGPGIPNVSPISLIASEIIAAVRACVTKEE